LHSTALGREGAKVAAAVVLRLAIDQCVVRIEAAHRLGDPGEPIGEVCAAPAPQRDALALLAGENAEAVVLHFV